MKAQHRQRSRRRPWLYFVSILSLTTAVCLPASPTMASNMSVSCPVAKTTSSLSKYFGVSSRGGSVVYHYDGFTITMTASKRGTCQSSVSISAADRRGRRASKVESWAWDEVKKAVGRCSNRSCLATENQARQDRANAERQRQAEAQRKKEEKQRRAEQQAAEDARRCQSAVDQNRDSLVRQGRNNILEQFKYKWRNNVKFYMDERWSSNYGFISFTGAGTWVNAYNATTQWRYTCSVGCTEWDFSGGNAGERWVGPKVSCSFLDDN